MRELSHYTGTDINKAIGFYQETCKDLDVLSVPVEEIGVDEEGIVHVDGQSFELTEPGLKTLSRVVSLPSRFASRIPPDLLSKNVNRLREEKDAILDIYYLDGALLSAVKSPSVSLPSDEILEHAMEILEGNSVKDLYLTPVEMNIQMTNPNLTIGDKKVGDVTEIGYLFNSSPVAYKRPSGQLFLHELACTNGMVVATRFGGFKLKVRAVETEKFVQRFFSNMENLNRLQGRLNKALERSHQAVPSFKEAYSIYGRIKRVTGDKELAMDCINLENEEDILELKSLSINEDRSLDDYPDATYRDVIYKTTQLANSFTGDTKLRLQKLGGKMLIGLS